MKKCKQFNTFQNNYNAQRSLNNAILLLSKRFLVNSKGRLHPRHWLTLISTALGVFALLTVSSVMNGFDKDMRQRIIGTRAEIRISGKNGKPVSNYSEIMKQFATKYPKNYIAPVIRNELMLVHGSNMAVTISHGIDLALHEQVNFILRPINQNSKYNISTRWLQGLLNSKINPNDFNANGIILGSELAQSIYASVGDTVLLVSPVGQVPTPFGLMPKSKAFKVVGIFIAGMPEYDRLYCYIPLSDSRFFSNYSDKEIDYFEVKTDDSKKIKRYTKAMQKDFPEYFVENWSSFDKSLYQAMHFEKFIFLIILGLMFILASFNMSGNIYKTIIQKRHSIGIIKTIGFDDKAVVKLFMRQGILISLSGIFLGIIIAMVFLLSQKQFGIISLPVGNLPNLVLPVDLRWFDFLSIPLIAFCVSLLSIWLPSRKAANVNPIELLREKY